MKLKRFSYSAVAISLASVLSAPAAAIKVYDADGTKFDITGSIRYGVNISESAASATPDEKENVFSGAQRTRLLFNFSQQFNDDIKITARQEFQQTGSFSNRYQRLGIHSGSHNLYMGRDYDAAYWGASGASAKTWWSGNLTWGSTAVDGQFPGLGGGFLDNYTRYHGAFDMVDVHLGFQLDTTSAGEKARGQSNGRYDAALNFKFMEKALQFAVGQSNYKIKHEGVGAIPASANPATGVITAATKGNTVYQGATDTMVALGYEKDDIAFGTHYVVSSYEVDHTGAQLPDYTVLEINGQYKLNGKHELQFVYTAYEEENVEDSKDTTLNLGYGNWITGKLYFFANYAMKLSDEPNDKNSALAYLYYYF